MKLPNGAGWRLKGSFFKGHRVEFYWPGRPDVTDVFPTFVYRCGLKRYFKFLEYQKQLMATCDCLGDYRKAFQKFLIAHPHCLDKLPFDTNVIHTF